MAIKPGQRGVVGGGETRGGADGDRLEQPLGERLAPAFVGTGHVSSTR